MGWESLGLNQRSKLADSCKQSWDMQTVAWVVDTFADTKLDILLGTQTFWVKKCV